MWLEFSVCLGPLFFQLSVVLQAFSGAFLLFDRFSLDPLDGRFADVEGFHSFTSDAVTNGDLLGDKPSHIISNALGRLLLVVEQVGLELLGC